METLGIVSILYCIIRVKGKNRDWQVLEVNVVMGIYKHLSKGGMSSSLPAFKCKLSEDLLAKRQ